MGMGLASGGKLVIPSNYRSPSRNQYMQTGRAIHNPGWWSNSGPGSLNMGIDMSAVDDRSLRCGDTEHEQVTTKRLQMGRAMSILWLSSFLKPTMDAKQPGTGSKQISFAHVDRGGDLAYAASAVRAIGDQGYIVEGMNRNGEVYLANGKNTRVLSCKELEENVRSDIRIRERSNGYSMDGMCVDELQWS